MSNTKPCLQEETMGSYSYIVIGILVFSTLAIFVGSTLGVVVFDNISENSNRSALPISAEPLYTLECNKPENILETVIKTKPGCLNEPVNQYLQNPKHHFVEMGEVVFIQDSFVDDLPICMSIEYGMDQWVVIGVKGGYTPKLGNYFGYEAYGLMTVTDKDGNKIYNDCIPGMFAGWLLDTYTEILCPDAGCCWTYYNFTLNPELCMNWICLDSSYDLDGVLCEDKYVLIEYDTLWQGCEFDVILAHVICVPGTPNSR
ncbi:MAG: hypothetical protein ACTSQU_04105 [Promethearchaeota archaeon]